MKKIICLLLVLSSLILTLSCGNTPPPPAITDQTEDPTQAAPETAPETASGPETKQIEASMFGLDPVIIRGKSDIVDISLAEDGTVSLTSKAAGSASFRIENNYSEAAILNVSVDENLKITTEVEAFRAPEHSVNVKKYGAMGNGYTDDTSAIQRSIDSLKNGGTVYIPKGTYMVSYLVFRENIHIRLAGNLPDATVGYTDEIADYVKNGDVAILRRNGKNSHMFYNLNKGGYCTEGVSNIALSGGMLDCITTGMAFVWACADGILFENCIVKDISNNHAIQIDGCSNVTINNIMFAGYTHGDALTRETIQIEPTTPGAISGDHANSPVKCYAGNFHYNKNIAITGCYFGKSDISGPHQTPVGHHSSADEATCDGLVFSGNVLDNPYMYGLHLTNYINVSIENNLFISTQKSMKYASDVAFINLYSRDNTVTYTDKNGINITSSHKNEQIGNKNIVIRNNRFVLGGNTYLRVLYINGTDMKPGATYTTGIKRVDTWGGAPYNYKGYVRSTNVIENIDFSNNTVELTGKTSYNNYLFRANAVFGFNFENNTFPSDEYRSKDACDFGNTTDAGECIRTIDARLAMGKIIFVTPNGEIEYKVKANGTLTLSAFGGRRIDVSVEKGVVRIEVDDLADFEGWFNNGNLYDLSAGFSGDITLEAKFKQN